MQLSVSKEKGLKNLPRTSLHWSTLSSSGYCRWKVSDLTGFQSHQVWNLSYEFQMLGSTLPACILHSKAVQSKWGRSGQLAVI